MGDVARSGAEALALAMGDLSRRMKAEALAARDEELARIGRESRAGMEREWDRQAARIKGADRCSKKPL